MCDEGAGNPPGEVEAVRISCKEGRTLHPESKSRNEGCWIGYRVTRNTAVNKLQDWAETQAVTILEAMHTVDVLCSAMAAAEAAHVWPSSFFFRAGKMLVVRPAMKQLT